MVEIEEQIKQLRLQIKAAEKESKRASNSGRHNWGDFHRNQHIKDMRRELQVLRESLKTKLQS